jgi:integrator complex subunit 6
MLGYSICFQVTGGRSYAVTSQRVLHQCIDSLVQKLQSGVVIHFEKVGPDPAPMRDGEITPDEDIATLSRADTIPLDELKEDDVLNAKGLNFNKELNGGCGSNPSRPHTPNPILASSNTAWHNCRRLIFVPRSAQKGFAVGFWPLPEAFWPDVNAPALPQRSGVDVTLKLFFFCHRRC